MLQFGFAALKLTSQISISFNPLLPNVPQMERLAKILILVQEGFIQNISCERRDYESVDEKILSEAMSQKNYEKRIQAVKG